MLTCRSRQSEYCLEYFRSYQDDLPESRLSAEELEKELARSKYLHSQLETDMKAVRLLQKIQQRHEIPFEVRLVTDDVGPRPNRRGSWLDISAWLQVQHWMRLSHDETMELKRQYRGDWQQACDDYLGTLQPSPERASRIYGQLLLDAKRYRFKTSLTEFMTGVGAYHWKAAGLLIVRRNGVAVYLPQKDLYFLDFLGELLFQGPCLLEDAVEGRIKKALRQVDWHERILDKLEEAGVFLEIKRKVRCANCEIDAVGVGQPYAKVGPNSVFVLEATPVLNYDALGQVEWYQHLVANQRSAQPFKGIVCERVPNEDFLNFCRQHGIAIFLVSYANVDIYEPE
jgi:hypothetical protein